MKKNQINLNRKLAAKTAANSSPLNNRTLDRFIRESKLPKL